MKIKFKINYKTKANNFFLPILMFGYGDSQIYVNILGLSIIFDFRKHNENV